MAALSGRLRIFGSVLGVFVVFTISGLWRDFLSRASRAALKRKSNGDGSGFRSEGVPVALGLDGVSSGPGSPLSLSASKPLTPESGTDLDRKLGIGSADGAGDA